MSKIAAIDFTYTSREAMIDAVRLYDPSADTVSLGNAYDYCVKAHADVIRHSGEPYYTHPIAVADILVGLKMDVASICTALLHDVLEDTPTTYEQMVGMFGQEITDLVDGVTKLGKKARMSSQLSEEQSKKRQQAENFQKFVLHMTKDVRVLLVKLCDRLHNMRTLGHHPKQASRERISRETMDLYAPLARRIGVDKICSELEDLSFQYLNPSAYQGIKKRLKDWHAGQAGEISQMFVALRELLDHNAIEARVYGREKRPYAIWRKLQRQGITFEDVADIYAFRILVKKVDVCYRILGLLHTNYRCVPARFRDFISVPKPNGYESLHTTIIGPGNTRIEIQIRTEEMEDEAERGIAAHWAYKDQSYTYDASRAQGKRRDPLSRLRAFSEILEQGADADEFLEHAKLEMFADQIFAFTPKGDLIALPRGATPIDFAYALHTDIGDTCIGAEINGRQRPLRTQLQSGDVVKVVRGGMAEPQPGWENMVVTGKARSALRRLTRTGESLEFQRLGERLAQHAFAREEMKLSPTALEDTRKRMGYDSVDDLYEALGKGELSIRKFMAGVLPGRDEKNAVAVYASRQFITDDTAALYIKGDGLTEGIGLHLSNCCSPIPGDRIIGIPTEGKGIIVHTIDCEVPDLDGEEEWLDIGWRRTAEHSASTGRVMATLEHVPGALADVTRVIGESGGNLTSIKTVKRSTIFFDMIMKIEVTDNRHLSNIIAAMRASIYVVSANRLRARFESEDNDNNDNG